MNRKNLKNPIAQFEAQPWERFCYHCNAWFEEDHECFEKHFSFEGEWLFCPDCRIQPRDGEKYYVQGRQRLKRVNL